MGLRFRRSMTLIPGVRLNFGKTGMSVSTGVRGFRQTYNLNTGKKTTTVGLPGTGIYYTTTDGGKKKESKPQNTQPSYTPSYNTPATDYNYNPVTPTSQPVPETRVETVVETKIVEVPAPKEKLTYDDIKNIFRVSDEKIDWFEILSSRKPTDKLFNKEMWKYLNSVALKICQGDIDTYLKVIQDINPYEDLLEYATDFDFGTDDASEMHISFKVLSELIDEKDKELFEDYVCGCAIRAIRDTFALLPVETVFVTAENKGKEILNVEVDRKSFERIKFSYSDPSDIIDCYSRK